MNSRRNFIKNTAMVSAAAVSIPSIVNAAFASGPKLKKINLQKNDTILFQGDSITDYYRDWSKTEFNTYAGLGHGYVLLASAHMLNHHAGKNLTIYNKGVSGNKVFQLAERWENDCIKLKPNVLSIMIGVNDFWHTLDYNYKGTLDVYKSDFKKLLDRTKKELPEIKLIIGEPFGIRGVKAVKDNWYPAFDGYRQAAHDIATEYGAIFIPYQTVFEKALEVAPGSYWTTDGVHPSIAGTSLMAEAWLKAIDG